MYIYQHVSGTSHYSTHLLSLKNILTVNWNSEFCSHLYFEKFSSIVLDFYSGSSLQKQLWFFYFVIVRRISPLRVLCKTSHFRMNRNELRMHLMLFGGAICKAERNEVVHIYEFLWQFLRTVVDISEESLPQNSSRDDFTRRMLKANVKI